MSDLCLVAAMVAKMQAAEQQVSLDLGPAAIDQVSSQAKHHSYKSVYQPIAAQALAHQSLALQQVALSRSGAEFSSATASPRSPKNCDESSRPAPTLASKISAEETLFVARASSASEALSKLTSPLYWEHRPVPNPQPSLINRPVSGSTTSSFPTVPAASRLGPRSGPQLYYQRLAAIKAGRLYTRLPADSFRAQWLNTRAHPDYKQWTQLLAIEARAVSKGQGNNRLSIVLGDSLSQWLPMQTLPHSQIWLNQGISGDTTRGILQRVSAFKDTSPSSIYVMAGVNDLKNGTTDREVLGNLQRIMRQLRANHPKAQVFVQSILPTDTPQVSNDRIRQINTQLATIARQENVTYLNLHNQFTNEAGNLNARLTTDGIHLSPEGYGLWQSILRNMEHWVALNRNLGYPTPWAS
ncbi:MAG: acylhydrolase [Synechococcales cyanobacterium CRU_2_2]|nr:acylhydrolase [Synechococcales cyanobacterium CRU_2_2]